MNIIEKYKKEYSGAYNGSSGAELVDKILSEYKVNSTLYRDWLIQTGGGPIGPDWYDSPEELPVSQRKHQNEDWKLTGFVIGWDGGGNPIVLQEDGSIKVEDHNSGENYDLAQSFELLLNRHLNTEQIS